MANVAQDVIWPKSGENVLVRVVFLYVGQGASAVVLVADGNTYKTLLVDINMDKKLGGIDVPKMMGELLNGGELAAFVNTHPHDDHLKGCLALSEEVDIREIWESGHEPSRKHGAAYYDELQKVATKVVKKHGSEAEKILKGSNSTVALGNAEYHVLAPADYLTGEVNDEEADERYRRIHEQCAVLKFGKGEHWIMIVGDADHVAFEEHITDYHEDHLAAFALGGSHHGSRTFFMENEEDEPYLDALEAIDPAYVIISAPTQKESPHGHPHDVAMSLYEDHVGADNVFHTGAERHCFIVDILNDGTTTAPRSDEGDLAAEYGLSDDNDGGDKKKAANAASGPFVPPKSSGGDQEPRRWASGMA